MKTIAIVNQKGGSGKTTTAISLSSALALRGQRTLLIDLDPQSHCASGLAIPESEIDLQIGDAMLWPDARPLPTDRFIWPTRTNLHVSPSTTKLAGLESARGGLATREDRDLRLTRVLNELQADYDWCVIDCPPYIGMLTFNALRAANEVLIPVETGYFALQGASKQIATIEALFRRTGRPIPYRLLPTMYDRGSSVADDVLEAIRRQFSETLTPIVVRVDEKVREAASMGSPVTEFAPTSPAAKDYAALASYIMENEPAIVTTAAAHAAHAAFATGETVSDGTDGPAAADSTYGDSGLGFDGAHELPNSTPSDGWARTGDLLGGAIEIETEHIPRAPNRANETLSRAAELAAKARQLASRSAEISKKIERDPDVARVMRNIDRPSAPRAVLGGDTQPPKPTHSTASKHKYGAIACNGGVLFVQPGGPEMEFCVAGDHNGWVPSATKLVYNPEREVHEIFVVAGPEPMRYRLVANGEWIADPYNPNAQANPYGGRDSIAQALGRINVQAQGSETGRDAQ